MAFYRPELLSDAEMAQFKGYLRDKWSAPDTPETEWMTVANAQVALDEMRAANAVELNTLDAIAHFIVDRSGLAADR